MKPVLHKATKNSGTGASQPLRDGGAGGTGLACTSDAAEDSGADGRMELPV